MKTFYFYDLETSGLNPRSDRIMQFAGQRTDENFFPIGEPTNLLVKLTDDTLPSPGAIMVTGITPQATQADGLSEAEFCRFFTEEVAIPDTTILGYNSVRFDDEFIRAILWRNFYDPYEWQWQDRRSRWDLLDVVRMTRALRPEGIEWPIVNDKATNRLELLTKCNNIEHTHAHDALGDVMALIEVAKLLKAKQPQIFDYLYSVRDKRQVQKLVNLENPQPFVYSSGRYDAGFAKTTVALPLAPASNGCVLVYDLRQDPAEVLKSEKVYPTLKKLQYNHCPAVAPLGVLEKDNGWQKIQLDKKQVADNLKKLKELAPEILQLFEKQEAEKSEFPPAVDPESALYDGFLNSQDRILCSAVRNNGADKLADFHPDFTDERLPELLLHYKAKNYPQSLAEDEQQKWQEYRKVRLESQASKFFTELAALQKTVAAGQGVGSRSVEDCQYLLEELSLWVQSLQDEDY